MLNGLVTALRTLSVLPVPGRDAQRFSDSLYWFPLVGLLLGFLEAGTGWLFMRADWPEFAAFAALLAGVVLTRGMHMDGAADVADGFFGGRNPDDRMRIMKDPAVGSFGAMALVLLFLLKWIVLVRLLALDGYAWIVAGVVLARFVQVCLAAALPYARREGGTASGFVAGARGGHVAAGLLFTLAALILLIPFPLHYPLLAVMAACATSMLVGLASQRKIGGVTGDVLGASSELVEAVVWLTGALCLLS